MVNQTRIKIIEKTKDFQKMDEFQITENMYEEMYLEQKKENKEL